MAARDVLDLRRRRRRAFFEPGVGGRIVERSKAGEESNWGEILVWEPPSRLAFTWHPGSAPDEPSTEVELRFVAVGDATRVELEHRGWEALAKPEETRSGYEQGWPGVLARYAAATSRLTLALRKNRRTKRRPP